MSEKIKKNENNEMWKKDKIFIIMTITIPALLILSMVYFYNAGYFSSPAQEKKPVIYLPTKWLGEIYVFNPINERMTYHNSTPLARYWMNEYLKNHTWTISVGNISLTLKPEYPELEGVGGIGGSGEIGLQVILNSTQYIGWVKYISNGTEMAIKNGGDVAVYAVEVNYRDKIESVKEIALPRDPSVAVVHTINFGMSNISFLCMDYVNIHERNTNITLPYNFTAYVETRRVIYRFDFRFNITNKYYPFIGLWESYYIPNATYYCYIPSEHKVVIADHLVDGTKYFFVEKDGRLSKITEVSSKVSD